MQNTIKHKPSKTAGGTTMFRAVANMEYEGSRFGSDHVARLFLDAQQSDEIKSKAYRAGFIKNMPPGMYEYFIARTQYFDGLFMNALNDGTGQIVLLGAGYDSRAHWFAEYNKGTKIIEIDAQTTQSEKIKRLKKAKIEIPGSVEFVSADFNENPLEDILRKTGFDGNRKTLFLMEGVSYYLEPESIDRLLESIRKISSDGTILAFDYLARVSEEKADGMHGLKESRSFMARRVPGEKNKFFIKENEIESFLNKKNFNMVEHLDNTEIEQKYLVDDGKLIGNIIATFRFVSASPVC